jgi:phosphatidate cytidylyltransferase
MKIFNALTSDKQRVTTGIVLVGIVLLVGIIDNFFLTWTFLGIAFIICFYESMKLFKLDNNFIYVYAVLLWIVAAFYPQPDDLIFLVLVVFASYLAYKGNIDKKLFLPFLYPSVSFLFLLSLYNDFGMMAFLWLLVLVAGTDIGAYAIGKSFGKTKFSPTSPNKTIEGVAGGVIVATFLGTFVGLYFTSFLYALLTSLIVSKASIFGDLFESYLKRQAGVKDSGHILPGHGGVLDRVDGYLFGGIVLTIFLRGVS